MLIRFVDQLILVSIFSNYLQTLRTIKLSLFCRLNIFLNKRRRSRSFFISVHYYDLLVMMGDEHELITQEKEKQVILYFS